MSFSRLISRSFASISVRQSCAPFRMCQPKPAASSAQAPYSPACTSSFFGTQPTLTQVPPQKRSSAIATRAPCCAAMRPHRTPADPPPITKRSKSIVLPRPEGSACGTAAVGVQSAARGGAAGLRLAIARMARDADLYDRDFVAWTEVQAAKLRDAAAARVDLPIDWENVAEEIGSLGRDNKRELGRRLDNIVEHLLKLRWSPDKHPAWRGTVIRERHEVEMLLEQSPSLRRLLPDLVAEAHRSEQELVVDELSDRGGITQADAARLRDELFSPDQILENWWPERAADSSRD